MFTGTTQAKAGKCLRQHVNDLSAACAAFRTAISETQSNQPSACNCCLLEVLCLLLFFSRTGLIIEAGHVIKTGFQGENRPHTGQKPHQIHLPMRTRLLEDRTDLRTHGAICDPP